MAINEGWGRRLRAAKRAYDERHDTDLTLDQIGEMVARAEGRAKPYKHPSVRAWFKGQEPASLGLIAAIAVALEVDPRDLSFGVPTGDVLAGAQRVPDAAVGRAKVITARAGKKSQRKAAAKKAPRQRSDGGKTS